MLEQPAALAQQALLIETAQTEQHSSDDASMAPVKTLSLATVHEHVRGLKGACRDSLVACWRKANAVVGDAKAVQYIPTFTHKQLNDWFNAIRDADVGKATEKKLGMQRKRKPVEAQAVDNKRRVEQFKFDFAGLVRIEDSGDGDQAGGWEGLSAYDVRSKHQIDFREHSKHHISI